MTQTDPNHNQGLRARHKRGVRYMIKQTLKVDMTPMVDLGFLLITFFVFTAELSRPTTMDLNMPKDGPPMELGKSNALTILLDNNRMYYYNGDWKNAISTGGITPTGFYGNGDLREVIGAKQKLLDITAKDTEGRGGLMVLIKPSTGASYRNVIDVLDEMSISLVKKYTIVKLSAEEKEWLKEK